MWWWVVVTWNLMLASNQEAALDRCVSMRVLGNCRWVRGVQEEGGTGMWPERHRLKARAQPHLGLGRTWSLHRPCCCCLSLQPLRGVGRQEGPEERRIISNFVTHRHDEHGLSTLMTHNAQNTWARRWSGAAVRWCKEVLSFSFTLPLHPNWKNPPYPTAERTRERKGNRK